MDYNSRRVGVVIVVVVVVVVVHTFKHGLTFEHLDRFLDIWREVEIG